MRIKKTHSWIDAPIDIKSSQHNIPQTQSKITTSAKKTLQTTPQTFAQPRKQTPQTSSKITTYIRECSKRKSRKHSIYSRIAFENIFFRLSPKLILERIGSRRGIIRGAPPAAPGPWPGFQRFWPILPYSPIDWPPSSQGQV